MPKKTTSEYLHDIQEEHHLGLSENSDGSEDASSTAQTQPRSKRGGKLAALFSVVVVVGIASGIAYMVHLNGTPGQHGNWLNPFASSAPKEAASDAAEARGKFRSGPYTEVQLQDIIDHRAHNVFYDPDSLLVANFKHPVKSGYIPNLTRVPFESAQANHKAASAYRQLNIEIDRKFGTPIDLEAAYIPIGKDEAMSEKNVDNTLGLALDLRAPSYKLENFLNSPKGKYVLEHCSELGLILRYPADKADKTGVPGVANKFRYVGIPHAEIISNQGICLDEYPDFLGVDTEHIHGAYVISRQHGPTFKVPTSAQSVTVSPDNTGYYIVTAKMTAGN